jgi:TetR/AcrR family transcriptional regulator, cholesterol catabolism regulator
MARRPKVSALVETSSPRKEQIVRAAITLMRERGYAKTSVREIGEAVGLYSGSLYHYIQEKEDILFIIQQSLNSLIKQIYDRVTQSDGDAVARLRLLISLHLRMVDQNMDLCHVGYTEGKYLPDYRQREIRVGQREYQNLVVSLIDEGQARSLFRGDLDSQLCATGIVMMLNSIIWWRTSSVSPTIDQVIHNYTEMLLGGLLTRPSS